MTRRGTEAADARRRHGAPMTAVLLLLLVVSGATAAPQLPIRADDDTTAASQRCTPHCDEASPRPVCGTDDTTYPSQCHLGLATCRGAPVQLQHVGSCVSSTGDSVCLRKRAEALQGHPGGSLPHNIYVPQCTEHGLYTEVQCHRGSGHCWCVDDYGRATLGTAVQHAQPDCSARTSRASTDVVVSSSNKRERVRKTRKRGGCRSRAKTVFRANIMQMIQREYERRRRNRNKGRRTGSQNLQKVAARWKFRRLDSNKDGKLSRREIRRLQKEGRRHLKPASCSRRFGRYCDTNSDRRLSRSEWLMCLGVNHDDNVQLEPVSVRSKVFQMLASNTDEKSADEQENSCEADRRQALDNQRLAEQEGTLTNSFFIPSCTPDHKYSRIQCHNTTGYCWCADPETGDSYQASVKDSLPDCSAAPPPATRTKARRGSQRKGGRLPKVCRSGDGLQTFLRLLMDHLTRRLIKALAVDPDILPPDTDGQKTFEEKVAEWKFGATDVNENRVLDRREWKTLRLEFSEQPDLKRCGRRLPRYCDADNDRKIQLDEWLVCVGAVQEERRPDKRPNPFEIYLTSSEH